MPHEKRLDYQKLSRNPSAPRFALKELLLEEMYKHKDFISLEHLVDCFLNYDSKPRFYEKEIVTVLEYMHGKLGWVEERNFADFDEEYRLTDKGRLEWTKILDTWGEPDRSGVPKGPRKRLSPLARKDESGQDLSF